jgi:hypothetical protein
MTLLLYAWQGNICNCANFSFRIIEGVGILKILQVPFDYLIRLLHMSIKEILKPAGLLVVLLLLIALGLAFSSAQKKDDPSKIFLNKAQVEDSNCISGKGSPLIANNKDLEYVYCSSSDNKPDVFFIEKGGDQDNLVKENELGAITLFESGKDKNLIGIMGDPVTLQNYLEIKRLIKKSDTLVFDSEEVGKKLTRLASIKGQNPQGFIWKMPEDFSECSANNLCIGIAFDSESYENMNCNSSLNVDIIWLSGANKIQRSFTETFLVNSTKSQVRQIVGLSPNERLLQILAIGCSS